jgi:membrane protein
MEAMRAEASRPAAGILATILGIGALLFAAIGVVVQLKNTLNVVWEVEESEGSGIWHIARKKLPFNIQSRLCESYCPFDRWLKRR